MNHEAESRRLAVAMGLFGVLGVLSLTTLSGAIRMVTLIVLGGLAAKTYVAHLKRKQEEAEGTADEDNQKD
ncbi:MAG: hypothetical protein IT165_05095 [Bryobacterales bacterium]|nr:hypothetical protein [Bryobacterales bacterium]